MFPKSFQMHFLPTAFFFGKQKEMFVMTSCDHLRGTIVCKLIDTLLTFVEAKNSIFPQNMG